MTSAEVKRVLCAVPAADGSAGLFKSCIFHSTRIVIRTYFSSSLDSPLWNESQKSTGGSNKTNYFKLPIVTVPGWGIEPSCARNAVTGNPCYYHSKGAKKGPSDVLWVTVQRANLDLQGWGHPTPRGEEALSQWTFKNATFLLENPSLNNCSWLQHSLVFIQSPAQKTQTWKKIVHAA